MKVVVVGKDRYESLEYHLAEAFKQLGHESKIIDTLKFTFHAGYGYLALRFSKKYDEYVHRRVADALVMEAPDLIVCAYRFVHPLAIKHVRRQLPACKIVQINPDNVMNFENQQIFVSPFDHYFTKEPFILDFMVNKLKLPTHYLPECFNHEVHKKPLMARQEAEESLQQSVIAMGAGYPYRALIIKQLVESDINLKVYGNVSEFRYTLDLIKNLHSQEYLVGHRKSEVLYGAKIVFNNLNYSEIAGVNCKFFEIMGCGGFQLMDSKPTVKEYIPDDIDPESFTFHTIDEAVDKIKYYLEHNDERIRIAERLYEHGLKHHTYKVRMQQMLDIIYPKQTS